MSTEDELLAECRAMVNQIDPPPTLRTPTAREVTVFVDETAKAEMRRQGRDPAAWDRLPAEVQDQLRLLALDRLRRLAQPPPALNGHEACHVWTEAVDDSVLVLTWPCGLVGRVEGGWVPRLYPEIAWSRHNWLLAHPGEVGMMLS